MKTDVIGIVPAPAGISAYYETDKRSQVGNIIASEKPVCCFVLVQIEGSAGDGRNGN